MVRRPTSLCRTIGAQNQCVRTVQGDNRGQIATIKRYGKTGFGISDRIFDRHSSSSLCNRARLAQRMLGAHLCDAMNSHCPKGHTGPRFDYLSNSDGVFLPQCVEAEPGSYLSRASRPVGPEIVIRLPWPVLIRKWGLSGIQGFKSSP